MPSAHSCRFLALFSELSSISLKISSLPKFKTVTALSLIIYSSPKSVLTIISLFQGKALTAVGKARAANNGINNLRI